MAIAEVDEVKTEDLNEINGDVVGATYETEYSGRDA